MKQFIAMLMILQLLLYACRAADAAVSPTATQMATATSLPTMEPEETHSPEPTATSSAKAFATPMIVAVMEPTATPVPPTPTLAPTPTAIPTSDVVDGWFLYQNEFYQYQISYPPEANVRKWGITGFDPAEKPAGLTFDQYVAQLRREYPDDICVSVAIKGGFVVIRPPEDEGGSYSHPCPGMGIGDYDVFPLTEEVVINGRTYTAEGWEIRERDEAGSWRNEYFFLDLEDGTRIVFGGGSNSIRESGEAVYQAYLATKEVLLQIVTSYMPIQ